MELPHYKRKGELVFIPSEIKEWKVKYREKVKTIEKLTAEIENKIWSKKQ